MTDMTDRELLEAAAEAAGMKVTGWNTQQGEEVAVMEDGSFWQPLHMNRITNADGDAFRLAVKLRMILDFDADAEGRICVVWCRGADFEDTEPRRAIVRAAAAISEGKE